MAQLIFFIYIKLSKFNEALEYLSKGLDINPKDSKLWYFKGEALLNLNELSEALDCFNKAIKIGIDNYYVFVSKAEILRKFQKPEQEIEALEKAIERLTISDLSIPLLLIAISIVFFSDSHQELASCST